MQRLSVQLAKKISYELQVILENLEQSMADVEACEGPRAKILKAQAVFKLRSQAQVAIEKKL